MVSSFIGGNTLIRPVIVECHWSEVQHVVLNVVGHVRFLHGSVHVEVHVVLHPVDLVVRPCDLTSESEVLIVYWDCAVLDHH